MYSPDQGLLRPPLSPSLAPLLLVLAVPFPLRTSHAASTAGARRTPGSKFLVTLNSANTKTTLSYLESRLDEEFAFVELRILK